MRMAKHGEETLHGLSISWISLRVDSPRGIYIEWVPMELCGSARLLALTFLSFKQ